MWEFPNYPWIKKYIQNHEENPNSGVEELVLETTDVSATRKCWV